MTDPVFPPEIECPIFTKALALQDAENPLNLFLVAKRVHAWLIQEYMKTIAVRDNRVKHRIPIRWNPKLLEGHGKHVRNLFLWVSELSKEEQYFILCPNVTSLHLWTASSIDPNQLDAMASPSLTRLSINLDNVKEITPRLIELFSRVTHVDIPDHSGSDEGSKRLTHFTSLTHLAISQNSLESKTDAALFFQRHPTLQVLVLYDHGFDFGVDERFDPGVDDPRVVIETYTNGSEITDWLSDVKAGRGLWGLADDAVRKRRQLVGTVENEEEESE